jgi:hypothetical protein
MSDSRLNLTGLVLASWLSSAAAILTTNPAVTRAADVVAEDDGDLARKADLLHSDQWQRAVAELGNWLATQSVYSPGQVQAIKVQFNERVAAMSSYELEYLLDSMTAKLKLLDTPEARDAKAWLGEYLAAMSDARRAQALRKVPNILDMSAAQLWQEIQRIDSQRTALQQRQQGVESRQAAMVDRASAGRQATSAASREAAARMRAAPAHSPYRSGGGSPPFSDVPPRRSSIGVGPMGAFITL